jgi:hypothetical protein
MLSINTLLTPTLDSRPTLGTKLFEPIRHAATPAPRRHRSPMSISLHGNVVTGVTLRRIRATTHQMAMYVSSITRFPTPLPKTEGR